MKLIAVALLFDAALLAQTPQLRFEVASIRAVTPAAGAPITAGIRIDGAQFRASMMPLRSLLAMAYQVRPYQLETPEWMSSPLFEISAALPEGHTQSDDVRPMLQALLTERFRMKTHRETKDIPVYALVLAKGGIQAKENPLDPVGRSLEAVATGSEASTATKLPRGATLAVGANKIEARKFTMGALADELSRRVDRPVVDQTGLAADAAYDLDLELTREDFLAMQVRAVIAAGMTPLPTAMKFLEASGDSFHTALAKLGLKLEPRKVPMEVLVIDSADRVPSEN